MGLMGELTGLLYSDELFSFKESFEMRGASPFQGKEAP
jgi:hypothetical protein